MNVPKALATVIGTAIGFGIAGTAIGFFLGKYTPDFYRQTFPIRDPDSFNPLQIGIGLGLINGLIWGLVIGILVVAIISWKETRHSRKHDEPKAK